MLRFSPSQRNSLEAALLGKSGPQLIELLALGDRGLADGGGSDAVRRSAVEAGVLEPEGDRFTSLGEVAYHSFREYRLWEEREREMPHLADVPELAAARFAGQRVLEVGSGFGCNLLSLAGRVHGVMVGVELDFVYCQMAPLLAAASGRPKTTIVQGAGERLPFPDASFDAVLCLSALQYMHVQTALAEIRRVLVPEGRAVISLKHLAGFLRCKVGSFRWARPPKAHVRDLIQILTVLTYPWMGRAVGLGHLPIHQTRGQMKRWFRASGLVVEAVRPVDQVTAYVVRRSAV